MGFGMATSLRRAGFDVTGATFPPTRLAAFVADGGKGAPTPARPPKQPALSSAWWSTPRKPRLFCSAKDGVVETLGKDAVFVSPRPWTNDAARRLAKQLEATGRTTGRADLRGAQRAAQGELYGSRLKAAQPLFAKAQRRCARCDGGKTVLNSATPQGRARFKMINQLLGPGVHIARPRKRSPSPQTGARYPESL